MVKVFKRLVRKNRSNKNINKSEPLQKTRSAKPKEQLLENELVYDDTNLTKQEQEGLKSLIERV